MHFQRYRIQQSLDDKKEKEQGDKVDSYYLRFISKYTETLLDKDSTTKAKILAAEMLGGFTDNFFVIDALETALEINEGIPLLIETIERALNDEFKVEEDDEYEKYVKETGIRREISNAVEEETARINREDRLLVQDSRQFDKYRAVLEYNLKRK